MFPKTPEFAGKGRPFQNKLQISLETKQINKPEEQTKKTSAKTKLMKNLALAEAWVLGVAIWLEV